MSVTSYLSLRDKVKTLFWRNRGDYRKSMEQVVLNTLLKIGCNFYTVNIRLIACLRLDREEYINWALNRRFGRIIWQILVAVFYCSSPWSLLCVFVVDVAHYCRQYQSTVAWQPGMEEIYISISVWLMGTMLLVGYVTCLPHWLTGAVPSHSGSPGHHFLCVGRRTVVA
jgi:hypothetical protein